MISFTKLYIFPILIASLVLISSCGKGDKTTSSSDKELLGAGATFPYPLYSKMFDTYSKEKNVKVNYQAVGSGAGIQQMTNRTVDFGASDAFMSDEEMSKSPAKIVHIPTCLGAVAITFNLPGITQLKLTPDVLALIFMGKINKWDDERIAKINPDIKFPTKAITVAHRSDGSGTTFIFTEYLNKVSSDWKGVVGNGKSVNWPVGLGGKGNEGVGALVKANIGAIGYVELIYALQNNMPVAELQNKKGNFVLPSLKSTNEAANVNLPEDTRISLTNSDADNGYPIVSFTWLLVYKDQKYNDRNEDKAKEVVKLLWWVTHEGQQFAEPLSYASLPPEAVKRVEALLNTITYGDKKVLDIK